MYSKLSSALPLLALGGLLDVAAGAALPMTKADFSAPTWSKNMHAPQVPPLPAFDDGSMTKRDAKSAFALRDSESFYYGTDAANPIANVTGHFPGKHEHVINMDRFAGMLSNVDCTNPDLMMDFKNADGFNYAKEAWSWVSENKDNKFLMVANYPGCGPTNQRQPFQVTGISYDEKKYKVFLKAHQVDWEEALPEWRVEANTRGLVHKKDKRSLFNWDKTFSPSIAQDFSKTLISTTVSGVDLSLDCQPCGIGGALDIEVKAAGTFSLSEASVTIKPSSVSAFLTFALHASGTLQSGYSTDIPVFSAPLPGGFDIPYVKIGPNMNIDVGASMSSWEGQATAQYGASLNIPDDSDIVIDFVGENSQFNGWVPTFQPNGPSFDASVTASAEVYAGASIDLSATIFSKGLQAGVLLKAPDLTGDFTAAVDTNGGICGNDKAGIDVDVHLGMDIAATAGFAGSNPFFSTDLYSTGVDLFSTCVGIGGANPTPTPTSSNNGTGPVVTPPPNNTDVQMRRRLAERRFQANRYF